MVKKYGKHGRRKEISRDNVRGQKKKHLKSRRQSTIFKKDMGKKTTHLIRAFIYTRVFSAHDKQNIPTSPLL